MKERAHCRNALQQRCVRAQPASVFAMNTIDLRFPEAHIGCLPGKGYKTIRPCLQLEVWRGIESTSVLFVRKGFQRARARIFGTTAGAEHAGSFQRSLTSRAQHEPQPIDRRYSYLVLGMMMARVSSTTVPSD